MRSLWRGSPSLVVILSAAALVVAACGGSESNDGGGGDDAAAAAPATDTGAPTNTGSAAETGAAGESGNAGEGKPVTFVGPIVAPVWTDASDAFKAEAEKHGMQPTYVAPTTVDIPGNVQQLETALASGAQGLATCALDPAAYEGPLLLAKERNVPVVLVDCDVPDESLRIAFVGTIGTTFGEATGQKLCEDTGGEGQVIIMQGTPDAQIQTDIREGFTSAVEACGIEIVATEYDNSDVQTAVTKFAALFRTYPEANIVHCIEANCPGAAVTVAKEQGRDDMQIIGIDDQGPTLDGIRDGLVIFSAAQPFAKMGRLAAQYLNDHFNGREVPSVTDTGIVFIDQSNVDTYKDSPDYK